MRACACRSFLQISTMQQPTPTTSRLETLGVLADADDLSAFGCHNSSVDLLVDYLEAARSSQQRWRMLQLEHNLLYQLAAAAAKALQLIGEVSVLDHVADHMLKSIWMLCLETCKCLPGKSTAAAGMSAVSGGWYLPDVALGVLGECYVLKASWCLINFA